MREVPLIVLGIGGVGRSLLYQIISNRRLHEERYGLALEVMAVCDHSSAAIELGHGINDANLEDLLELKSAGGSLAEHALGGARYAGLQELVSVTGRPGAIVVDVTATDHTIPALLHAIEQEYRIVLANKKPLTATQEAYDRLTRAGVTVGMGTDQGDSVYTQPLPVRWETTVGAGLPVIATQQRLVSSGDKIHRIAGTFSGTLGYVMTGLEEGRKLSEIVREAHSLGYTEPDPRDDLGGIDVARKALILARGLGWTLEMDDVEVTGLYPAAMDDLSVDEFMAALPDLDAEFGAQVKEAAAAGNVLRFAAEIEAGRCKVGPTVVAADSPLGRLTGTDNLVEFHSRWYTPNPLVIQGRGAGVEVTAAGVLSDIVELALQ
jgi:homoserine dehydrogenase